jgi:hypothetical protein
MEDYELESEQETEPCRACEYFAEVIEGVNRELASLRAKYAGAVLGLSFPASPDTPTPPEVDYFSPERRRDEELEEKLQADLKFFALGRLNHQRSAHAA